MHMKSLVVSLVMVVLLCNMALAEGLGDLSRALSQPPAANNQNNGQNNNQGNQGNGQNQNNGQNNNQNQNNGGFNWGTSRSSNKGDNWFGGGQNNNSGANYFGYTHDWVSLGFKFGAQLSLWAQEAYGSSDNGIDGESLLCGVVAMRSLVGIWGDACVSYGLQRVNGSRPYGFLFRTGLSYKLQNNLYVLVGPRFHYHASNSVLLTTDPMTKMSKASILQGTTADYGAGIDLRLKAGRFMLEAGFALMGAQAMDAHDASNTFRSFMVMANLGGGFFLTGH
jgi:hypothetical protein